MPLLVTYQDAPPEPGSKRRLAVVVAVLVVLLAVVGLWTELRPGSYGQSQAGCVTVTIPSSTGGALLHDCGSRAQMLCRHAFGHSGRLALLIRPACRQAGLG